MGSSENPQHAIRRSTRLPLEVPVLVTSLDPAFSFSERCSTTLVNAHGCGLIAPRELAKGIQVRLEIVSAKRHTTAQVAEVVPLGGDPETWLAGLELEIPGNFWGIEYAPSDWKIEEIPQPALERRTTPDPVPGTKAGPVRRWRLTDISSGACYLESASPFVVGTPVLVSIRALNAEFLLDGLVRASHAHNGMGIAFIPSDDQRSKVRDLIAQLTSNREAPRVFVGRKEGQSATPNEAADKPRDGEESDPLLDLVLDGSTLTAEQFLSDLRAQRLGKRRDPRIEIALPVLLTAVDVRGRPLDQRVVTANISRRGALLEGIHGELTPGNSVTLTRGKRKEEFRVAWVVDDNSPAGAQIGVAAADPNTSFWDEVLGATAQSGLEATSLRDDRSEDG